MKMKADVKSILQAIPDRVCWSDVVQFDRMDQRVLTADELCGDVIGVNEGYVEFCPNSKPPSVMETLVWWWVVRPDLGAAIAFEAPGTLRRAIADYIDE